MRLVIIRFSSACILLSVAIVAHMAIAGDYCDLVSLTLSACKNKDMLMMPSFTNQVTQFRNASSNQTECCAADLALAIADMQRFDTSSDAFAFERHQQLVSNIVFSATLPSNSWVKYAAAFEYSCGFNADNKNDVGFSILTNQLAAMAAFPPDMAQTNFWEGIMLLEGCGNMDIESAFNVSAALEMSRQGRISEIDIYTNSLSEAALSIFREEL